MCETKCTENVKDGDKGRGWNGHSTLEAFILERINNQIAKVCRSLFHLEINAGMHCSAAIVSGWPGSSAPFVEKKLEILTGDLA